jgi:HEAT repeat protein
MESRDLVAKLLDDPDNWVRLNAAGSIPLFGKKAEPALPALRRALTSDDKSLKERAQESIEKIQKAEDQAAAEKEHQRLLEQIERFAAALKAG